MAQNWRNDDHKDRESQHPVQGGQRDTSREPSLGQRAFGHDKSTGAPRSTEQHEPRKFGGEVNRRPGGGWQDPDRTYSAEARGEHQSHDPWSQSGGYGRYGYGSPAGYGEGSQRPQRAGDAMGGHDPHGQHGLGGERYGESRHPQGRYGEPGHGGERGGWEGGYGRRPGGEGYSEYGAQDQGWGRGEQGGGDFGPPSQSGSSQGSHQHQEHETFDPEYRRWRSEQISKLDEDYRMWRQERQSKFDHEFEGWRQGRASVGGGQAGSSSGGAEAKADGGYLPAGHNETMKAPAISGGGTSATGGDNQRPTEDDNAKIEDPNRR